MENTFKSEEGLDPITEGNLIGIYITPSKPIEIKIKKKVGVILIGMPYLYQGGDTSFHLEMVRLGLKRRSPLLCGLKHKVIWADEHEYLLTDLDDPKEFCNKYKLEATYTKEDFIKTIKKQLEEQQ